MPKRTPLQHTNPVKHQAIDLLSDPQNVAEDEQSDHDIDLTVGYERPYASGAIVRPHNPSRSGDVANHELQAATFQQKSETGGTVSVMSDVAASSAMASSEVIVNSGTVAAPPSSSASNPHSPSAVQPHSPAANRERFMKGFLPARTCCNLDLCKASPGTKFNLTAICIAVFPATTNPDRRYIQLADVTGSVGVTLWNHNVHMFSTESVGRLVSLGKVIIYNHNGKKQLSMARDSSVQIVDDDQHVVSSWWRRLLDTPPVSCGGAHDESDHTIISVCGVLGLVTTETKMVNNIPKLLLSLHMVDASGKLDIRSWNHTPSMFDDYVDRPILIRRVRVTSFAGTKLCELLDGVGSVIETSFPGAQSLAKFWSS